MIKHASLALIAAAAGLAASAGAGPIDPPAGPVGASMKSLVEVEPRTPVTAETCPGDEDSLFKITEPGSYYLTGNIDGVSARHGVEIAASGVTLDLNGFKLAGVPGSLSGVETHSSVDGVSVRNGHITGWGGDGVSVVVTIGQRSGVVEGIVASGNGGRGIHAGTSAIVRNCSAHDNGQSGIVVYAVSVVEGCSSFANGATGIYGSEGCTISGCTVSANQDGISAGIGATVKACVSRWNYQTGIRAINGSTVEGCTSYKNQADGIYVTEGCAVRSNNCYDNDGPQSAGIRVSGGSNRIEGNNLTSNSVAGLRVDGTVNIVAGNTARANGVNYVIVSGNRVGTIVVPPLSGAINGNGGAAGSGTTDPWSNIAY